MVQKKIMYILLSSAEARAKNILNEKLSLLFGNFEIIDVGPLDYQASLSFIQKRLKGIDLTTTLENFLIDFTSGNPFYLDIICSEIQDVYFEISKIPYDPYEILLHAFKNLMFDKHGVLSQYFTNFLMTISHKDSGTKLISILMVVANKHTRIKDIAKLMRSSNKDLQQKLNRLQENGVIFKNGNFYYFKDKVFPFWLKFVYQKRITDLGWDVEIKEKEFREGLFSYIKEVDESSRLPFSRRLVDIFSTFNNEIVQINDKRFKMPTFKQMDILESAENKFSILAQSDNSTWLIQAVGSFLGENDTTEFINSCKNFTQKVNRRLIIGLSGMDINAKLLAMENKISIWDAQGVNLLFNIAGETGIILNENSSIS
jgi:hypothetical protein